MKTKSFYSGILFLFSLNILNAQHQLISQVGVNSVNDPIEVEAYSEEGYIVMPGKWGSQVVNTISGEWATTEFYCQDVVEFDDFNLYLGRNGVYRFIDGKFQNVTPNLGEDHFPFSSLIRQTGSSAFFTSRFNEIWVTDGTENGTEMVDSLDGEIKFIFPLEDTLHVISEGEIIVHHAININDGNSVINNLPYPIDPLTIYPNQQLHLKSFLDEGYGLYSLTSREIKYIQEPEGSRFVLEEVKKIGDEYFNTRWLHNWQLAEGTNYIYRIDFETPSVEQIYSSPQPVYMRGLSDCFDSEDGIIFINATPEHGCELYRIDENNELYLIKDIYPGPQGGIKHPSFSTTSNTQHLNEVRQAISHQGMVYFAAISPEEGLEFWRTDGTESGTVRVSNFYDGPAGASWISPFIVDNELYAFVHDGGNNVIYKIDTEFSGYPEESDEDQAEEWDKYFLRDGRSNEYYHTAEREPQIISRSDGLVGIIQGFRKENANYLDKWREMNGDFESEIPEAGFSDRSSFLYYLDAEGELKKSMWITSHGNLCEITSPPESDDLYLTLGHLDQSKIGDYRIDFEGRGTVLVKLDADGEILWHKIYNEDRGIHIHGIEATAEAIYVSGYYWSGLLELGDGVSLSSIYSPQYFTAAFDLDGNAKWAVNTPMEGVARYSALGQITTDARTGYIYTSSSEHGFNTWNSCGFGTWMGRVNALDMESGRVLWTKDFVVNDKFRIRDLKTDVRGNLWVGGTFRGTAVYDNQYSYTAEGESDCPENSFVLILDGNNGSLMNRIESNEDNKRFRKFLRRPAYMDVFSFIHSKESEYDEAPFTRFSVWVIEKITYTLNGTVAGVGTYATRDNVLDINDEDASAKLAVADLDDGHFVMKAFFPFGHHGLIGAKASALGFSRSCTNIFKRHHPEVLPAENFTHTNFTSQGFLIYPNPLSSLQTLTIVIDPDRLKEFDFFEIYDLQGRVVLSKRINKLHYSMNYNLPQLSEGVYVVVLKGEEIQLSNKLIVTN